MAWLPGDAGQPPRVAFAVGRRVGGAVVRNRIRRRLRSLARDTGLPAGAYLVAVAPGAADLPYAELGSALAAAVAEVTGRPGPLRP